MEPSLPTAGALAIAGEWIVGGVGTHEAALAPPDRVDLGGRCVLPGLNDSHVHFPTWALAQGEVRLEGTGSLEEAVARVREALGGVQQGRWLRGRGWRSADWAPVVEPTRHVLDEVTGSVPTILTARDSHSCWLNSAALALADGDLAVPGGVVEVDSTGEPTGVLREESCWHFRGSSAGEFAGRHRDPRQGRLARRARGLPAARRGGLAPAAGLAVAALRAGRGARRGRPAVGLRQPAAPGRVPEGVHGRDARLADRADARRVRSADHEPRRVGGDRSRRRSGRVPGRRARDRRT